VAKHHMARSDVDLKMEKLGGAVELLEDMQYELGEVNSVYIDYSVFPTSKEMIQAEVHVEDKENCRYL
ncbi:hypothetical protein Tco_0184667, partial [Tanacetum coccineum]